MRIQHRAVTVAAYRVRSVITWCVFRRRRMMTQSPLATSISMRFRISTQGIRALPPDITAGRPTLWKSMQPRRQSQRSFFVTVFSQVKLTASRAQCLGSHLPLSDFIDIPSMLHPRHCSDYCFSMRSMCFLILGAGRLVNHRTHCILVPCQGLRIELTTLGDALR